MDTPVGGAVTVWPAPAGGGALAAADDADAVAAARVAAAFLLGYQGRTREAYAADLTRYWVWCAGAGVKVLGARRAHVDAWVESMRAAGAAPATVARRLAAVAGFYAYAVEEEVCERNPVARVRRPRVGENVQSTGLSAAEARLLLDAAAAHSARAETVVALLLFCGLRVSELCGAGVADLGRERGHRVVTVTRKGGHRQTMVVPPRAADALERYLAGRETGPLVATASGRPMDRQAIWRLLRRLAADALPHLAGSLHPHDLRHACATLALDTGASLRDVQDLLGHRDSRTTRRYDRARHNLDRSPVYALAALIGGQSGLDSASDRAD